MTLRQLFLLVTACAIVSLLLMRPVTHIAHNGWSHFDDPWLHWGWLAGLDIAARYDTIDEGSKSAAFAAVMWWFLSLALHMLGFIWLCTMFYNAWMRLGAKPAVQEKSKTTRKYEPTMDRWS